MRKNRLNPPKLWHNLTANQDGSQIFFTREANEIFGKANIFVTFSQSVLLREWKTFLQKRLLKVTSYNRFLQVF